MKLRPPLQQLILAIVAGLLLFAQVNGLHRHLHLEAAGAAQSQVGELYFGDAGLHVDEEHALRTGIVDPHAHGHVEVGALGDALAKLALDLLPILALAAAMFVPAPRTALRIRRPDSLAAVLQPHPFALHPPANGPPRLISQPL